MSSGGQPKIGTFGTALAILSGMDTQNSKNLDDAAEILASLEDHVEALLKQGACPAALTYTLTAVALELGLQLAPNPEAAFAIVLGAARDVSTRRADFSESSATSNDSEEKQSGVPEGTTVH